MKKLLLIPVLLTFSISDSNAQFQVSGVNGSGIATGTNTIPPTTIIIGNGTTVRNGNTFVGQGTGMTSTWSLTNTNDNNTFVGQSVAPNNVGNLNTFIGQGAGGANTQGSVNTFVGAWSGQSNNTGHENTFIGMISGRDNTYGSENTFLGQYTGVSNTTGGQNTFIGKNAGMKNVSGSTNTALGYYANFAFDNLTNATVIGANATCSTSNAIILGTETATTPTPDHISVGIGTATPAFGVHLHTKNDVSETVRFETTNSSNGSNTMVDVTTPSASLQLTMNNISNTNNLLGSLTSPAIAPAISKENMATLLTGGNSMAIGKINPENSTGSIYFLNSIATTNGPQIAECMVINKANGFVGVNTRTANTAGGSGEPQAFFHVNLTNPINSAANNDVYRRMHGIRFEGLPHADYDSVIVIDHDGNLAKAPYAGGGGGSSINCDSVKKCAWSLSGNTTGGMEWIGTDAVFPDDFRIRTSGVQRARFTDNGNFDLGGNVFAATTTTSAAVGTNNLLIGGVGSITTSSFASGTNNTINSGTSSLASGQENQVIMSSTNSQAMGMYNIIEASIQSTAIGEGNTLRNMVYLGGSEGGAFAAGVKNNLENSYAVMALGAENEITTSYECVAAGESNTITDGHGCFIGGGHNTTIGWYNFIVGDRNSITNGTNNFVGGSSNVSHGSNNLLLGNGLKTTAGPMTHAHPLTDNIMIIGEQINSDLHQSLTMGYEGNRTCIITQKGVAIQLDPKGLVSASTYNPTVNFEVNASPIGAAPLPPPTTINSNIRFHNLPVATDYPAVIVNPVTGELFMSTHSYAKPSDNSSDMDSLYKENEALKSQIAQLQSKISGYDEKFASLERSLVQICENGCAGLNMHNNDELYQSIPNPATNDVTISYYLSNNYSNANISIVTMDGKKIRAYNVNPNKGNGTLNISLAELQPGVYLYNLTVDGKQVGAKKLQKQ